MFAVIKTGGKQYKVAKDDIIVVEKLTGDAGAAIEIEDVLMIGEPDKEPTVGAGGLDKASVSAEVVEQTRGDKIIVFKKNRRHNYRRKKGHRQDLTVLRITGINATGKKAAAKPAAKKAAPKKADDAKPDAKPEAKPETKPAAKKAAPKKAAAPKKTAAKAPAKKVAPKKTTDTSKE